MKRLLIVLLAVTFFSHVAFAQEPRPTREPLCVSQDVLDDFNAIQQAYSGILDSIEEDTSLTEVVFDLQGVRYDMIELAVPDCIIPLKMAQIEIIDASIDRIFATLAVGAGWIQRSEWELRIDLLTDRQAKADEKILEAISAAGLIVDSD